MGEARWFLGKNVQNQQLLGLTLSSNEEVQEFNPDVVIVPGNVVPDFWPGIKVQIFHGLGEEKKGHYRITGFFDLYCTPGPHMTQKFNVLEQKHESFLVKETGWPKLDAISQYSNSEKVPESCQFETNDPIILYAPTFSPRYTSAPALIPQIRSLMDKPLNWLIKFHDLMDKNLVKRVKELECKNIKIVESNNIIPLMAESDILIADTSSVTYEYLLFNKPIITYKSTTRRDKGLNIDLPEELFGAIVRSLEDPNEFSEIQKSYLAELHPYYDGKSSERLIKTILEIIRGNQLTGLKKKNPGWMRKRQARKQFSQ